ncbi:hypothetical protein [Desulfosporosinus sp. SB140]|uniref:hypothetical protein n=1 Tax=Desulfosporosinus paludis TaxID=3115649 RepID=UPI00388FBB4B
MLSLIAFGIIALIVVALLLTFNIRSFNRTETVQTIHPEDKAAANEPRLDIEHKAFDKNQEEPILDKKDPVLNLSDQEYRNTLRQYHVQKKSGSPVSSTAKHTDKEYRAALRSMRSPKG